MKCTRCNKSINEAPLHRTKPVGQYNAGWMCLDCIKTLPEDKRNEILKGFSDIEYYLDAIFYKR